MSGKEIPATITKDYQNIFFNHIILITNETTTLGNCHYCALFLYGKCTDTIKKRDETRNEERNAGKRSDGDEERNDAPQRDGNENT